MSDDIVTRLREIANDEVYKAEISVDRLYEAADEIERLRALVEHLASQVRLQQIANGKAWEAYEQVVRGE